MIGMCSALEELRQEGVQEGIQKGIQKSIQVAVRLCKGFTNNKDIAVEKLMEEYSLSKDEAANYVNMYW